MHTGAMIALVPSEADATRLAVDGGEPADELHCTLAYLGKADQLDTAVRQDLLDAVTTAANGTATVDADAFALSAFNPTGDEPCLVLGLGGAALAALHARIIASLPELPVTQRAPWAPHITVEYTDDLTRLAALTDRVGPVRFDRLRVTFAGQATDIPLLDPAEGGQVFTERSDPGWPSNPGRTPTGPVSVRLVEAGALIDMRPDDLVGDALFGEAFDHSQARWPKGHEHGGRFRPKAGGDSAAAGGHHAATSPLNDHEFAERAARVEKVVGGARTTLSTDVTHTTPGGAWLPERDAVHREIARSLYEQHTAGVPTEGKAVIAGGLGGAGKSTVLRDHAGVDQSKYVTLNPDDVKEELARRGLVPVIPGHEDLSPMERAALVHEESSRITALLADMAYRDRRNVIWDITMSSEKSVASRVTALKAAGYGSVDGVFVDIPVETSVERAMARYRRGVDKYRGGTGFGGRYVPPSIIRAQRTSSGETVNREVFDKLRPSFTGWAAYDNSVTGQPAQLIDRSGG